MNTKTDLDDALADLRVSRKITDHTMRVFDYLDSGLLSTNLTARKTEKPQKTSSEENE
jgi:hypothetical protein